MEKTVGVSASVSELRITDIMRLLPHRSPFLLVDRVKDLVPGVSGTGIKNVTADEPFFQGHFPENPIMPGVLQVEAMAQTAGLVVLSSFPEAEQTGQHVYFMTIDAVKFRKPVLPGDVLELRVKREQSAHNVFKFRGEAYVADTLVSQAVFSAMITNQ